MKKNTWWILSTALLMCLTFPVQVYAQKDETEKMAVEQTVWEALGQDAAQWAGDLDAADVEMLTYCVQGEEKAEYSVSDTQLIEETLAALDEITVIGASDIYAADAGDAFIFRMKDGSDRTVEFCMSCLYANEMSYETYGAEDLWELAGRIIEEAESAGAQEETELQKQAAGETTLIQASSGQFTDLVLIDNEDLTLRVSCEDTDLSDGYTWTLDLVSHSADRLLLSIDDTAINTSMCQAEDCQLSGEELCGGGIATAQLTWSAQALQEAGISEVEYVTLSLKVSSRKEKESIDRTVCDGLYVLSVTEEAQEEAARRPEPIIAQVIDDKDYYFAVTDCLTDEEGYPLWKVWMENRSEKSVSFSMKDAVLNGEALENGWTCTVLPGKSCSAQISWWSMTMNPQKFQVLSSARLSLVISRENAKGALVAVKTQKAEFYPNGETSVEAGQAKETGEDSAKAAQAGETDEVSTEVGRLQDTENISEETGKGASSQAARAQEELCLAQADTLQVFLTDIEYSAAERYYILELTLYNEGLQKLRFEADSLVLDGYEMNPGWIESVPAGSSKDCSIAVNLPKDEEISDTVIKELSLHLTAENEDADLLLDQKIRVNSLKFLLISSKSLMTEAVEETA